MTGSVTLTIPAWLWLLFLTVMVLAWMSMVAHAILKIRLAYWKWRLKIAQEETGDMT